MKIQHRGNQHQVFIAIILIDLMFFVMAEALGIFQRPFCALYLLASPEFTLHHFRIWQLLTANFFYSHPICLGLDVGILWIAGRGVESRYGGREFLGFYLTACVVSVLGWLCSEILASGLTICLAFSNTAGAAAPVYINGASGAIMAVLTLWALSAPAHQVRVFGLWVPAWLVAAAYLLFGAYAESHGLSARNTVEAQVTGAVFAYVVRRFDSRLSGPLWRLRLHGLHGSGWYRIRFSVLSLMCIVLTVGECLGWLVRAAELQRDAVTAVEKAGGAVTYESAPNDERFILNVASPSPTWFVDQLGADYFGNVVGISFQSRQGGSDAELELIGQLSRLQSLNLCDSLVTDAGLSHIAGLHNLSDLRLARTGVGDDGLFNLRGLERLRILDLGFTKISNAGLVNLKEMRNLIYLDLGGTRVGDDGLAHVGRMVQLRQLSLRGTEISDTEFDYLRSLRNLEMLDLSETRISDAGIVDLKRMYGLEHLSLRGTNVGERGIEQLKTLSSLVTLELPEGKVLSGDSLKSWRRGEGKE